MLAFGFHFILIFCFSVFLSSLSVHAEPCHIPNDPHTVHFNELLTLIIQKAISEIFTESKKKKKKAYGELISFLRIGFLKASGSGKVELGLSFQGVEGVAGRRGSELQWSICDRALQVPGSSARGRRSTGS